jgi:alkylation response protein AidB-like acyl-CoA dehydrogenase
MEASDGKYRPPLKDIVFALEHVADLAALSKLQEFSHADPETAGVLLEECGRFAADVLAPLDRGGDLAGCSFRPDSGAVAMPEGWQHAYRRYVEGGWGSVPFEAQYGGGGFPWLVATAMQEMITSANMSFSLCPLLTQGAIHMLALHGSPEQKALFLPKMVSGEWTGTMNLTEPQAGSDVGALITRAVPADDGTWRISGQKIFITYGEHDLSANIVHLVLARVPGAPAGTRGISCFIVPKFLLDTDGRPAERNSVRCAAIEHKMGIHASPTCVMEFDEATGYLVGEANAGMGYMFTMMNSARLAVGVEGLAVAEAAYQKAFAFARERVQGRPVGAGPGSEAAIVEHPDVRRMLFTMRSLIEAMRGVLYLNAQAIDLAARAASTAEREANQELCDVLTPISKAWCTYTGERVVSTAVQVHGGMGFIEETGVAQHYRDIRIASIYEGTNGIQAIDLATRKLRIRDGGAVGDLIARVEALDVELGQAGEPLAKIRRSLSTACEAVRRSTGWLLQRHADRDTAAVLAGASPYLEQWGLLAGGWVLARQALASLSASQSDPYLAAKLATARFYFEQILPAASSLAGAVTSGEDPLYEVAAGDLQSS